MPKLEDVVGYVVVDAETDGVWREEVFYNQTGAKTAWAAAKRYYDRAKNQWIKPKFNEQTRYVVVKVKLVEIVE